MNRTRKGYHANEQAVTDNYIQNRKTKNRILFREIKKKQKRKPLCSYKTMILLRIMRQPSNYT